MFAGGRGCGGDVGVADDAGARGDCVVEAVKVPATVKKV